MKAKRTGILLVAAVCAAALLLWGGWSLATNGIGDKTANAPYNGHGGTFKNTLAEIDTPDPSIVYANGYYYMTFTHNGADIMVMKSRTLDFRQAERKVVWYPPPDTMYSSGIWAPEIQHLQGRWYIYFAADDGANENHRMYALEADTEDPMGDYTFKGQVTDETNRWAIDGLAVEHENKLYFVWSGWEGDVNIRQNTYIAPMSDPLTISGPRVLLSEPDLEWEQAGGPPFINEGQAILKKDGRLFIVYSGAGSWTPFYSLGMLALAPGGDPLDPSAWTKSAQPLLQMDEEAEVYGPGHNTFVASPDGTEHWIVYHATSGYTDGWNNRKARAQKIEWNEDGTPHFGKPLSLDTAIPNPAGSGVFRAEHANAASGKLEFDLIPSSVETEAPLLIHYRNPAGASRSLDIWVNGEQAGTAALPATEADAPGYAYAFVPLQSGHNNIGFPLADDGLQVEAVEIPRYEAESAQAESMAATADHPHASGSGIAQIEGGKGTALRFAQVNVPVPGTYRLGLAVSNPSGSDAALDIKVDGGKKRSLAIPATERNQYIVAAVEMKLKSGTNVITLENATGRLNLDYIDITR